MILIYAKESVRCEWVLVVTELLVNGTQCNNSTTGISLTYAHLQFLSHKLPVNVLSY